MTKTLNLAIRDFLAGRIWLREHSPFQFEEVKEQIEKGHIQTMQGVTSSHSLLRKSIHFCNRCENDDQKTFTTFYCENCEGNCTYCRHCLKMGRVSTCTELIYWVGEQPEFPKKHHLAWQGTLTPRQQKAAKELSRSNEQQKSHLLYAVCGAGKTEILFEPIYQLLKEGKRVCVAAPRVDVILELEPRFRTAFPTTKIQALYGGAESSQDCAQLILATTHQLYRFYKAFDVIFVDEADAFPYTADERLRRAVKKSAKDQAPIHAVTATPSKAQIVQAEKADAISILNRRYHNHPLPVPHYESLWHYTKQIEKGKLPKKLLAWTKERIEKEEPFLIFFHHIALMMQAAPLFQQVDARIQAVHAAAENRKEFVQALRNQEIPGLLTTTILERGITIPNVQVAVVGAEQQIFNKGALIQIGGRVGRSAVHPDGELVFFHHGISYAMDHARSEIERLNKGGI